MSTPSPLYPIQNESRAALTLDGLWRFQFDPRAEGEAAGVEYFIVEQDVCLKDPFDSLADSLHYLVENFVK